MKVRWLNREVISYEPARNRSGSILFGGESRQVKKLIRKLQFLNDEGEWEDIPEVYERVGCEQGSGSVK